MSSTVLHDDGIDSDSAASIRGQLGRLGVRIGLPPGACADLALIATELITNALRAGAGELRVSLDQVAPKLIRLRVVDDAPGTPRRIDAAVDEVRGRGLMIVAAIAEAWGYECAADHHSGKSVWATLAY